MSYFHAKRFDRPFNVVVEAARTALAEEGFGVITEIDVQATLKAKLGEAFRPYLILGACNPGLALEALKLEPKVGLMLPCNVVVQDLGKLVEVAVIDPTASMQAIDNPPLRAHAAKVGERLAKALERLPSAL